MCEGAYSTIDGKSFFFSSRKRNYVPTSKGYTYSTHQEQNLMLLENLEINSLLLLRICITKRRFDQTSMIHEVLFVFPLNYLLWVRNAFFQYFKFYNLFPSFSIKLES